MTDASFSQRTDADGTAQLTVAGEIDMATSPALGALLRAAIEADDTKRVAVDLSQLTFLDSSGIRELVLAHEQANERGIALYVTNPHRIPRRILEITGLFTVLTEQAPSGEA